MSHKTRFNVMGIILLIAVILSACAPATTPTVEPPATSEPESTTVATEAPTEAATEVPAATEAPVDATKPSGKVTLWMWKAAHDTLVNSGVLDEFKKEYPDIEVEIVEYAPADVYQKLPLALQAGTGAPDISLVENSHLAQIVALGGLTDMTEWVTPYIDKMNAYKWQDAKLDDKYYAMPWDSGPVVFYYRRDVFEAADVLKKLTFLSHEKKLSFREQTYLEKARFLIVSEVRFRAPRDERALILAMQFRIGVRDHRPKLVEREFVSVASHPPGEEQDRPGAGHAHSDGRHGPR